MASTPTINLSIRPQSCSAPAVPSPLSTQSASFQEQSQRNSSVAHKSTRRMSIGNKLKSMFGGVHPTQQQQQHYHLQGLTTQANSSPDSQSSCLQSVSLLPDYNQTSSSDSCHSSSLHSSPSTSQSFFSGSSSTASTIQLRASLLNNKQHRNVTTAHLSTQAVSPSSAALYTARKLSLPSSPLQTSNRHSSAAAPHIPLESTGSSGTALHISVTECHVTTCLLIPSNWSVFPKIIAQQLKAFRFVVIDQIPQDSKHSSNVPGNLKNSETSFISSSSTAATNHNGTAMALTTQSTTSSAATLTNNTQLSINQLGPHLHSLRNARRLEKLGGMLREMVGVGKKVRDDATSALPDLGLDPSQLNSAIDIPDTSTKNISPNRVEENGSPPKLASNGLVDVNATAPTAHYKRGNLTLLSSLIAQIERGERDVNSVVEGVSPASQLSNNNTINSPGTQPNNELQQSNPQSSNSTITNTVPHPTTPTTASTPVPAQSLLQKYGKCQEIVGKGTYGIVRVAHKFDKTLNREILFAVKEFKRRAQESEKHFSKRLTSEYCISSSLHDNNIIHTLDLMRDGRGECCQVMEFCDGGDLYSLILASEGGLKQGEADCFFKQLVRGVVYMHSMGVAHCDLKPENLLLTCTGSLKISDFGNAECFQMAWENEVHLSSGVCGSRPYIAPEQFKDRDFDPRAVDIWATGVIYMVMRTGSYLWRVASLDEDLLYEKYLMGRKQKHGFEPIEALRRAKCRNVIYSILDPIPSRRITGKQILNSEWGRSIQICHAGERGY